MKIKQLYSGVRYIVWRILFVLANIIPHKPRMTVLLYHSISQSSDFFSVSPSEFEKQIKYITQHFEVVPLSRAFQHALGEKVTQNSVSVTFDDGYVDFITDALPILKKYKIFSTVFVLGESPDRAELDNDHPLLLRKDLSSLKGTLVSIGSHGLTHRKIKKLKTSEVEHELMGSRKEITNATGTAPSYFAYPKGSYNDEVKEFVKKAGYFGAVSVVERSVNYTDDIYALPRIQVDGSTTFDIFTAKLSRAADWYYGLWQLAKRFRHR